MVATTIRGPSTRRRITPEDKNRAYDAATPFASDDVRALRVRSPHLLWINEEIHVCPTCGSGNLARALTRDEREPLVDRDDLREHLCGPTYDKARTAIAHYQRAHPRSRRSR